MKPSKKSPEIEQYLEEIGGRTTAITSNRCVRPPFGCGGPAESFRDEGSVKEYTISGLCQKCQDELFGK